MAISLTKPTVGGSENTWGTTVNNALDQLNEYDRFARKTADETVTSSITLQNDDALSVAVVASATYLVEWGLRIDGATGGDFKYAFTGPTGATMVWESLGHDTGDTTNVAPRLNDVAAIGTAQAHGALGAGTKSRVLGRGVLVVSTTAGTLQLQWAQNTSNATATTVFGESWLRVRRMV